MPTVRRSRVWGALLVAVAVAVLAASGTTASMAWFAAGAAAGPAHPGCVEALLKPPTLSTKSGIRRGGQDVEVFLDYPAVEGCESFGRRSQIRFETKAGDGSWAPPAGANGWISLTHGLAGTDSAIEVGVGGDDAPDLPLPCMNGNRPRVRVQVRTRAIILATMKNDGQSPFKTFLIPYEPASAAHCG